MYHKSNVGRKAVWLAAFFIICAKIATAQLPAEYDENMPTNYIRVWEAKAPEKNPNVLIANSFSKVAQSTQYFDGLGRPLQTVVKKGSMITGSDPVDMVMPVIYDELGRETYKYLPFAASYTGTNTSVNDGLFKLNPFQQQEAFMQSQYGSQGETYFYAKTVFEASPLNRILKTFAPGNNWVGQEGQMLDRSVKMNYYTNTDLDVVRIWKVDDGTLGTFGTYSSLDIYDAGELFKISMLNEDNKQVIEFKDKEGKVILKKVQLTANPDLGLGSDHDDWLCTYYIYDDLNNLRCVIQPEGVKAISSTWILTTTVLDEQCFRYEYDYRDRAIMNKIPGIGAVWVVYDGLDRMVMSQDAKMRADGNWLVIKYDELNRPTESGRWTNSTLFTTHLTTASSSDNYPSIASGYELLTITHYDNYAGLPSGLSASYLTTWNGNFTATNNSQWPYPQMPVQSNAVKGLITWTQAKVLESNPVQFVSVVNIYDNKGRVIQLQSTNITGGTDVITTQYTWMSQPLVTVQRQEKSGSPSQENIVVTKFEYDDLGRQLSVKNSVSNMANSVTITRAEQEIVRNSYNKLGQLSTKKLAPAYNGNAGLEVLTYDYNIRGWVLGINRDYAKDLHNNNYFGFDLGYEKANNGIIGGQTYSNPRYNGNIEGMVWKSKGDGEKRKYDFVYDAADRLLRADFAQFTNGTFNQDAGVNFNVKMGNGIDPTLAYDANGNILQMQQWGLKITGSDQIDNLRYTYMPGSNKLKSVTDFDNDAQTNLGDFRTASTHPQYSTKTALIPSSSLSSFEAIADYTYDVNGNMNLDNNKGISSINYNHLNLPSVVTVAGKGTITYVYDANGIKLKKITGELASGSNNNIATTTTTIYLGGTVYESKTDNDPFTTDYADKIQFLGHEEGRIRAIYGNSSTSNILTDFAYDYMLKDHLGNVRMVLTEEIQPAGIYQATIEDGRRTLESELFTNVPETESPKPTPGFDTDNNNAKVTKLFNASGNDKRTGPGVVLKVMAGDKFKALVSGWYQPGSTNTSTLPGATDILGNLLNAFADGVPAGASHTGSEIGNSGALSSPVTGFLGYQNSQYNSSRPKAFLNWIVLDEEQFKLVENNYGVIQIPEISGGMAKQAMLANSGADIEIKKNGYLYVFVSNESQGSVYFDDLRVEHTRGPILEETHYYPFGLTMAGISSKALEFGEPGNKYKFTGQLLDDDLGWDTYQMKFRTHDPQIGRFLQIDPLADQYVHNSTYAYAENDVIRAIDVEGLEKWITTNNQVAYGPYSPEYASTNKLKPLISVIKSVKLIAAFEKGMKESETFQTLPAKADLYNKTITDDKTGTFTDNTGNMNVNETTVDKRVFGLTFELTNSSNSSAGNTLANAAFEGEISKKEYVMGVFKIEASAMVNSVIVGQEANLKGTFAPKEVVTLIEQFNNKEITKEQLIGKVAEFGYNNASSTMRDGQKKLLRDAYGEQYDTIQGSNPDKKKKKITL